MSTTTTNAAPVADWITAGELYDDPFPIFRRLRAEAPVAWVPAVSRYLVTGYDGVRTVDTDQETFSADEDGALMKRAMGHSMLRKDDPEHLVERRAWMPSLKPLAVRRVWAQTFRETAERFLDGFAAGSTGGDLHADFAGPYAAECLRVLLGFRNATWQDLLRWSQTMIDATSNYADDPDVWAAGLRSYTEVDDALDEMLDWHARHPDDSLISTLLSADDHRMPLEAIRANLKMTIGGGINEPRDVIGVATGALLDDAALRQRVRDGETGWGAVFDESVRWVAPIGMVPRQTTREATLDGVVLPAGAKVGICFLSANRDETVWDAPDAFDPDRARHPHLGFGKGTHVCAGAVVAKAEVEAALDVLFERLPSLRRAPGAPSRMGGWVFRGYLGLPVEWDPARD